MDEGRASNAPHHRAAERLSGMNKKLASAAGGVLIVRCWRSFLSPNSRLLSWCRRIVWLYVWAIWMWANPDGTVACQGKYMNVASNIGVFANFRSNCLMGDLSEHGFPEKSFIIHLSQILLHVISKTHRIDHNPGSRIAVTGTTVGYDGKRNRQCIRIGQDKLSHEHDGHTVFVPHHYSLQYYFVPKSNLISVKIQSVVPKAFQFSFKGRFNHYHKSLHFFMNSSAFIAGCSYNFPHAETSARIHTIGGSNSKEHVLELLDFAKSHGFARVIMPRNTIAAYNNRVGRSHSYYRGLRPSSVIARQRGKQEDKDIDDSLAHIWGDGPLSKAWIISVEEFGHADFHDGKRWFHFFGPQCKRNLPNYRPNLKSGHILWGELN